MYKIGEFSRLSQVPIRTLRYYDQLGLLVPAEVARPSGYRCYAAAQLERLNRILALKDLGLSLREIQDALADAASPGELRALIRDKHAELARRVDAEHRRLARAAARLAVMERCDAVLADIVVRDTGAPWIASVRRTLRCHDDCDALFDELDHGLARSLGRRPSRAQRGAIWHACAPRAVDCEVYAILPGRIAAPAVTVRQLPAQHVAALIYRGDTDYLPAYRAMRTWIAASGFHIAGPKRELFLRSPSAMTEIQFPIARPTTRHRGDRQGARC